MTTDANSSVAFYCPVHQVRFHAIPAEVIECEQAPHSVGYGFPYDDVWIYCCACATFSPHDITGNNAQLNECPVCEREVGKKCLCHSCQVLTIESVVLIHRKVHSIDADGVKPSCAGCGSAPAQTVLPHDCPELGLSFLTARPSCLLCESQIAISVGPQNEAILCDSCGDKMVAPYRFCRKCGKARSQIETDDVDQKSIDEEPTDADPIDVESLSDSVDEPAPQLEPAYVSSWDYSPAPVPYKRRTPMLIGTAAALLSVTILIVVSLTNSNRSPQAIPPESRLPESPPGMVYIGGGDFMMGSNAGDEYERPAHKVETGPFFMDLTEVTCEDYLKYLSATARRNPRHWTTQTCQPGSERQPVTGIDWEDAKAYADWANKRLPTELEWEFAARGVQGTMYPWGNAWRANAANAGDSSAQRLMDVGSYPNGRSPIGVMDLIGNAWEWTSSEVVVYPGGSLSSPFPQDVKVVRGGSWREANNEATATYRGFLHKTNAKDYSATGFRCVKDVGPTAISTPNGLGQR
jgi:formylglycine-generating enzyme required for sulfatase activity